MNLHRQTAEVFFLLCLCVYPSVWPEPTTEDIEHLMFDLEEAKPEERDLFISKLASTMSARAAPALMTVLTTFNEDDLEPTRDLAERYAARLADGRIVSNCREMLQAKEPLVRRYAVRLLPYAGTPEAVTLIKKSMKDEELMVRSAAIGALGNTMDEKQIPFLEKLADSSNSHVSGPAKFALRTLKWQTGKRPREDFSKRIWPKRTIVQVGRKSFWGDFIGNGRLHSRLQVSDFPPGELDEKFTDSLKSTRLLILSSIGEGALDSLFGKTKTSEAILQFLKSGGTVVIDGSPRSREAQKFFKAIDVALPQGAKPDTYSAVPAIEEVHSLTGWPLKISSQSSGEDGRVCWQYWAKNQSAPYRNQASPAMAAMVVQENVLGSGRVVFNGISEMYDIAQRHCDMVENLIATAWDSPDRTLYYFFRLLHDFETPSWKFAKPWAGKKLKVCFIGDKYLKRDIVELVRRTDLFDYEYATIVERREGPYGRNSNTLEGASVVDIQQKLAGDYDLYVIARRGFGVTRKPWELLPEEIRRYILRRVVRGAGLLIIGSGAGTGKQEVPDEELDEIRKLPLLGDEITLLRGAQPYPLNKRQRWQLEESLVRLHYGGKGRVAHIDNFPNPGPKFSSPGLFSPFRRFRPHDYWYSVFLRVLLWAGRNEAEVQILEAEPKLATTPAFQAPAVRLKLRNSGKEALKVNISIETIDLTNAVTGSGTGQTAIGPGSEKEIEVALAPLPAGIHVARISLRDPAGKALNWAAVPIQVESPVKMAGVQWDKPVYWSGDHINASVKLNGKVPSPGASLKARLVDTRGRLMWEKTSDIKEGVSSVVVTIPVNEPVAILADLHLKLIHEKGPLAEEQYPVTFKWPRKDLQDFKWYLWRNSARGDERWATVKLGADYAHAGPEQCENSLRFSGAINLLGLDKAGGRAGGGGGTSRRPCYQNTNVHQKAIQIVRQKATAFLKAGIRDFMLEDEATMGGQFCFCPSCLFHFRDWARRHFKSLEYLNAEWGTDFKDWEDVRGQALGELKDPNQPGAWLDHRRYMDSVFTGRVRRYREEIQIHIPDATVGLSGTQRQSPSGNYDWWQLCHAGNLWLAYGGAQTKMRRSWRTPDTVMALWSGGYGRHDSNEIITRRRPWNYLFNRYDAYAYYWGGTDAFIMLEPDLTPINKAAWTGDEIAKLKQGIGKMLLRSNLDTFGIGMHYSVSSQYSSYPTSRLQKRRPGFMGNLLSLGMPFEDLRRQFRYVAYQEIEMGDLLNMNFKLLLMPNSQAISKREAEGIRKFVEAGGVAVADFAAAQRNQHGAWQKQGLLEDVFGVTVHKPTSEFQTARLEVTNRFGSIEPGDFGEFPAPFGDSIRATTATPHATLKLNEQTAPALFVNNFGKGRGVYLNFSFNGYGGLRVRGFGGELTDVERLKAEQGERIRRLATVLIDLAGVDRSIKWERHDNQTDFSDAYIYHNGSLSYLGVTPGTYQEDPVDWNKRDDYVIKLSKKAFVYDCREEKYVGEGTEVKAHPVTGMSTLYALLPYKVVSVKAGRGSFKQGDKVHFPLDIAVSNGKPGEHVIHVNVIDAAGKLRLEYRQNQVTVDGKASASFPLALNDPIGEWKLTLRDAATGVRSETKFKVQKR